MRTIAHPRNHGGSYYEWARRSNQLIERDDRLPERELWASVLIQALHDRRVAFYKEEVGRFFNSEGDNGKVFKYICGILDLEWEAVRDRVNEGKVLWISK